MLSDIHKRDAHWATVVFSLAVSLLPMSALAQDEVDMPYVTEEICSEVLADLVAGDAARDAELSFATNVCYASRLVDFRDRLENRENPPDNGTTRSLPKASDPVSGTSPGVDRQVEDAALRSEETWDKLAQGDPKAAYDLLRRLIGDQGSGS
jgi:hypothetical protein